MSNFRTIMVDFELSFFAFVNVFEFLLTTCGWRWNRNKTIIFDIVKKHIRVMNIACHSFLSNFISFFMFIMSKAGVSFVKTKFTQQFNIFLSIFVYLQLPQTDLDALDPNCRRFRLENGESLAEIDEVMIFCC